VQAEKQSENPSKVPGWWGQMPGVATGMSWGLQHAAPNSAQPWRVAAVATTLLGH